MSTLFRYLLSFAVQMAWRRAGKGGAIPPMRLPGKGRQPVNLPIIGPWQMMAATWVLKRVWGKYGSQIKNHLANNSNDLTRRAAQYIPDPKGAVPGVTSTTSSTGNAPAVKPIPTPAPTPRPAPNFNTQVLGSDSTTNAPASTSSQSSLPQGSILGKLRGRS